MKRCLAPILIPCPSWTQTEDSDRCADHAGLQHGTIAPSPHLTPVVDRLQAIVDLVDARIRDELVDYEDVRQDFGEALRLALEAMHILNAVPFRVGGAGG